VLSFRYVKDEVCKKYLKLFKDRHSAASALYSYENELHLSVADDQKLIELLADRANNPDYNYVAKLFYQYREDILDSRNGKPMFERLANVINDYNTSGQEKAIIQEYDTQIRKSYILYIVTDLMC